MTSVADTRLLLTFQFPPSSEVRNRASKLLQEELARGMLLPSIVITEYLKIAGVKVGMEAALTHIGGLESRGAEIVEIDRELAVEAGRLLLTSTRVPIADALIAAVQRNRKAAYVITDDLHFAELGVKTLWL